jgi:D-alanyl-D-alanine endopeptidase (penicillin-binding protein 7)
LINEYSSRIFAVALLVLLTTISGTALADSLSSLANRMAQLEGEPELRSASVLILDDAGNIIYGKDIDTVRSIASITKLMTAMVVLDSGLDLDERISITKKDRDLVRLTGSRLDYGATLARRELLQLALMSSENRAANALGRAFPGGIEQFVVSMNDKAKTLGMVDSYFADPAGLKAENVATAKDLAQLLVAANQYPLIKQATTTTRQRVQPYAKRGPLDYVNTNRLLRNNQWDIMLSKTGYINEAGRCLVMRANIEGEPVSIVLLNSFGKLTPFGDSNRLKHWLARS